MRQHRKFHRLRQALLYGCAALVLLVFLGKNSAAYEAHLADVRNSAGPPLPVGAALPDFTLEDADGTIVESSQLPGDAVLVLAIVNCPYAQAELEKRNVQEGAENVYAIYIGITSKEDREIFQEFSRRFENLHVLRDRENSAKWAFRCRGYPTIYTVQDGETAQKVVGYESKFSPASEEF